MEIDDIIEMIPPLSKIQLSQMTYRERQEYREMYMPLVLSNLSQERIAKILAFLDNNAIPDERVLSQNHKPSDYLWFLYFRYIKVLMIESELLYGIYHSNRAEREIYPHVVVGCELDEKRALGKTKSGLVNLHPALSVALFQTTHLIPINYNRFVYPNIFSGTCAEDHAAHQVLQGRQINSINELKDITFTFPFRPRTLEYMPPCYTCDTIFTSYTL